MVFIQFIWLSRPRIAPPRLCSTSTRWPVCPGTRSRWSRSPARTQPCWPHPAASPMTWACQAPSPASTTTRARARWSITRSFPTASCTRTDTVTCPLRPCPLTSAPIMMPQIQSQLDPVCKQAMPLEQVEWLIVSHKEIWDKYFQIQTNFSEFHRPLRVPRVLGRQQHCNEHGVRDLIPAPPLLKPEHLRSHWILQCICIRIGYYKWWLCDCWNRWKVCGNGFIINFPTWYNTFISDHCGFIRCVERFTYFGINGKNVTSCSPFWKPSLVQKSCDTELSSSMWTKGMRPSLTASLTAVSARARPNPLFRYESIVVSIPILPSL